MIICSGHYSAISFRVLVLVVVFRYGIYLRTLRSVDDELSVDAKHDCKHCEH